MKIITTFFLMLLVAACARTPVEPFLSDDVHVIGYEQLPEYWLLENKKVSFRTRWPDDQQPPCGMITLSYIIDSNGNVFNAQVIRSEPKGYFDWPGVKSLALRRFSPAPSNARRLPVKVTQDIQFKNSKAECVNATGESPDSRATFGN
ncbi:MAG: energy transducer TonB [Lysobacterales bacterium]